MAQILFLSPVRFGRLAGRAGGSGLVDESTVLVPGSDDKPGQSGSTAAGDWDQIDDCSLAIAELVEGMIDD